MLCIGSFFSYAVDRMFFRYAVQILSRVVAIAVGVCLTGGNGLVEIDRLEQSEIDSLLSTFSIEGPSC